MKLSFNEIDSDLTNWANKYGLCIDKEYQETPVRSVQIIDNKGNKFHLWVEIEIDRFNIHLWDYSQRKWSVICTQEEFMNHLEDAYSVFIKWIKENDSDRTYV